MEKLSCENYRANQHLDWPQKPKGHRWDPEGREPVAFNTRSAALIISRAANSNQDANSADK